MPLVRILAATLASAALAVPAASLPSASAETAAKATRVVNAKIVNVTPQRLSLHVHVRHYASQPTFLQKKACKSCNWHKIDTKKTNNVGRVAYPVDAPRNGRWYYRAGTPERVNFLQSYSQTFYTYTTTA